MKISVYENFPDCAKEIRKTVFIDEQGFQDEFDETDNEAAHFVMFDEDETPVATCRVFWNEVMNAYALGRFAVVKKYRGRQIGSALMKAVEKYVQKNGGKDIVLHAQCQAAGFYEKSGFTEFGNIEEEQGCPHIWMKKAVGKESVENRMEGRLPGMNKLKFNFQLKELDKIKPFGEDADRSLHWFGLTDGLFWIDAGTQTIYEYSAEADTFFDGCGKYNDYYIARFLEDFTRTFRYVGESIPEKLYNDIDKFSEKAEQWRIYHEEEEDAVFDLFFDEEYCAFCEWWWNRGFDSGHLIGGPDINCVRCGDKIKILWESAFQTGSGKSIWTAPKGCFEMAYEEFISSVTDFFHSFFDAMDRQIEDAGKKEWGSIELDKQRIIIENEERKLDFFDQLNFLKNNDEQTNWEKVMMLYDQMEQEMTR